MLPAGRYDVCARRGQDFKIRKDRPKTRLRVHLHASLGCQTTTFLRYQVLRLAGVSCELPLGWCGGLGWVALALIGIGNHISDGKMT